MGESWNINRDLHTGPLQPLYVLGLKTLLFRCTVDVVLLFTLECVFQFIWYLFDFIVTL